MFLNSGDEQDARDDAVVSGLSTATTRENGESIGPVIPDCPLAVCRTGQQRYPAEPDGDEVGCLVANIAEIKRPRLNSETLHDGSRILSACILPTELKTWIFTEAADDSVAAGRALSACGLPSDGEFVALWFE